jgi:hypothetical protein
VTRAPEALLAKDSLVYLRFDGLAAHADAYRQTALAAVMNGDLGQFLASIGRLLKDGTQAAMEDVPAELRDRSMKLFAQFLDHVARHGAVLGVEVLSPGAEPRFQITIVFPQAGKAEHRNVVQELFAMIAETNAVEVQKHRKHGRTIHACKLEEATCAWWREGDHLVLVLGTEPPSRTLELVSGRPREGEAPAEPHTRRANLTENPIYRQMTRDQSYAPLAQGFVDLEPILTMAAGQAEPEVARLVEQLGVLGLKSISFRCGFEGKSTRTTVTLHTGEARQGLLKLLAGPAAVDLSKLPPIPPDASAVSVLSFDFVKAYDVLAELAANCLQAADPERAAELKMYKKAAERMLGLDVRNDIFGSLGPTVVLYNSPGEGPLVLGTGAAIEVTDPERLHRSLEQLCRACTTLAGAEISFKKSSYHGVDLYTLSAVGTQGLPVAPSYAVHDGWLVVGLYPQRVQGHILRAVEGYPCWKPSPLLEQTLADAQAKGHKVVSWSETDPRPNVKFLLSLAPLLGGVINAQIPGGQFNPAMIPNAHNVTRPLFPNVTLVMDDGPSIRWETHASLPVPCDLGEMLGCLYGVPMLVEAVGALGCPPPCVGCQTWEASVTQHLRTEPTFSVPSVLGSSTGALVGSPPVSAKPGVLIGSDPAVWPRQETCPVPCPPSTAPGYSVSVPCTPIARCPAPVAPASCTALPPVPPDLPSSKMSVKAYPVADLATPEGHEPQADTLMRLVKMVAPTSWQECGGPGAVDYYPPSGSLIIRQTDEVHAEIAALIDEIRQTMPRCHATPVICTPFFTTFYRSSAAGLPALWGGVGSAALRGVPASGVSCEMCAGYVLDLAGGCYRFFGMPVVTQAFEPIDGPRHSEHIVACCGPCEPMPPGGSRAAVPVCRPGSCGVGVSEWVCVPPGHSAPAPPPPLMRWAPALPFMTTYRVVEPLPPPQGPPPVPPAALPHPPVMQAPYYPPIHTPSPVPPQVPVPPPPLPPVGQPPLTLKTYAVADLIVPPQEGEPTQEATIIRLVKMVEPQSWDDRGGPAAIDYYPLGQCLVVRQSAEAHEQIDRLLRDLRAMTQPAATQVGSSTSLRQIVEKWLGIDQGPAVIRVRCW